MMMMAVMMVMTVLMMISDDDSDYDDDDGDNNMSTTECHSPTRHHGDCWMTELFRHREDATHPSPNYLKY